MASKKEITVSDIINTILKFHKRYSTDIFKGNEEPKYKLYIRDINTIIKQMKSVTLPDEDIKKLIDSVIVHDLDKLKFSFNERELVKAKYSELAELGKNIVLEEKKPENLNEYIRNLKIYKINQSALEIVHYTSNNALFYDLLKMIRNSKLSLYKRVYLKRVADKITSNLPDNFSLENEDYELAQIIRLIQVDEKFNSALMGSKASAASTINKKLANDEYQINLINIERAKKLYK